MGAVADECTTHNPSYAEHVAVAAMWMFAPYAFCLRELRADV